MRTRQTNKLRDKELRSQVARARAAGEAREWSDGGGLKLTLTPAGRARWVHKFQWKGKTAERWFAGQYPDDVSLAAARDQRDEDRRLLRAGKNPIVEAQTAKGVPTFTEYCRTHAGFLAPPKARLAWERQVGLAPSDGVTVGALGGMEIDSIGLPEVKRLIEPLWQTKPPTAKALLGAVRRVIDHRRANTGDERRNPADFKLVQRALGRKYRHVRTPRRALPWQETPAFMAALSERASFGARCLEWVILCGVRVNEATPMTWGEIDFRTRAWTIPAIRMKAQDDEAGEDHVVPLSRASLAVLRRVRRVLPTAPEPGDLVFPNQRGKPYDHKEVLAHVHALAGNGVATTHGFRSTITDWGTSVAHRTRPAFSKDLMMSVIAHVVGSTTDRAYARSRWLEQRRVVHREWSRFACPPGYASATVVPLRRAA